MRQKPTGPPKSDNLPLATSDLNDISFKSKEDELVDQALFALLHVLVFVYWLGGDLGAFYTSRFLIQPDISADRRLMAAKIVGDAGGFCSDQQMIGRAGCCDIPENSPQNGQTHQNKSRFQSVSPAVKLTQ